MSEEGKGALTESAAQDHASPAEAAAALERLESADLLRLEKIARLRVRGMPHVEWQDLLQTAIERVLAGTRKWPQHVPIVAFMAGVMRSIANEYWEQHNRTMEAGIYREADLTSDVDSNRDGIIASAASNAPNPELELMAKEELDKVETLFTHDEQALAIVMARAEEYTPDEIQESFEITKTQYDSALKRIRRKLIRDAENGDDE